MSEINVPVVLGAGPAGLTAAWILNRNGKTNSVLIESDTQVGGISKTININGWRFDLGGHRFFSKSKQVNDLWDSMLFPDKFQKRPRKSRIYYNGKFFDYPLKPFNALFGLGVIESILCVASFLTTKIFPPKDQTSFEGWVAARFGWRLYRIFFKTYTEKVWGISTTKLQATWAAQRIKNLSLSTAILNAIGIGKAKEITSLIEDFKYPKFGPGQLWENAASTLVKDGCSLLLNEEVQKVVFVENTYKIFTSNNNMFASKAVFSSLPLGQIPTLLNAPAEILNSARKLRYRDFLIVCIPVKLTKELFDDNWIYIHDPEVGVGRIQNYGSWSEHMVREGTTCLGLEYFVNENDHIWKMNDEELFNLGIKELSKIGITIESIDNSCFVVRVKKAYPVYDEDYKYAVKSIQEWLSKEHPNWFQIGRNGQHRYNNQDHSMLTAKYAVESYIGLETQDYWKVNLDDDYHELGTTNRNAPVYNS